MTTAIAFSRQNNAGSHVCTTKYCGNLILVVILVLESKGLLFFTHFLQHSSSFSRLCTLFEAFHWVIFHLIDQRESAHDCQTAFPPKQTTHQQQS